ncbi:MAG: 2-oxoacid:ferredoxin oxidoreductase subunit beta [Phycisphaerales bacterium]|nr:2-oxoacid:ferredoxin oxidoreductase subunit beta [Phycisphaerales bacterium]
MNVANPTSFAAPKPSDYGSDQDVRWCPGCGDYAILAQMKKVMAKMNADRSKTVFISGIGCSSRFPYYMNTYGFHSIHGRAPTLATGLKLARPDLDVWVITGDGDALSIGGNHVIHAMRRNVDIKLLLFNNRVYGLTKGQYSPTTEQQKPSKSAPMGVPDLPIHPLSLAVACNATFVARTLDRDIKHMEYVLERAARHRGSAFVEIYQNCNIFNDGAFNYATDRTTGKDHVIYLEHGKPLVFGHNDDKVVRVANMKMEVVNRDSVAEDQLLVHDEKAVNTSLAFLLSRMHHPEMPEPVGVFRDIEYATYGDVVVNQSEQARQRFGTSDLQQLVAGNDTWEVQ